MKARIKVILHFISIMKVRVITTLNWMQVIDKWGEGGGGGGVE